MYRKECARPGQRRANYHLIMTLFLAVGMGLAAIAIDLSWMRLAKIQCQDVADAAANAALIELRRTGSTTLATAAAEEFVARNVVGDSPPDLLAIEFGRWDESTLTFTLDSASPHAVRTVVGRPSTNPLKLYFAQFVGMYDFSIQEEAIAATRSMQVILVMDITGSFAANIGSARAAALRFLDLLEATHGAYDMIGMTVYYYRFGVEYTPLTYLDTEMYDGSIRTAWGLIDTASKPDPTWYFTYGGLHPDMPREYYDEGGTDHHTGIEMAITMFSENPDPFAFKALVMLTDGYPSGLGASDDRFYDGYTETRWRQYEGPMINSTSQIRTATLDATLRAWQDYNVHVWSVSYDAQDQFLVDMTRGVGQFYYTQSADQLDDIFAEIASSLPIAIVR